MTNLRAVVAIPARDEVERIGSCLQALAVQTGITAGGYGVLLFLNNCRDGTDRLVEALRPALPFPLRVIRRDLAQATAGSARRAAMEAAASWLESEGEGEGVILTTDADSRVGPDWVARCCDGIEAGADAVAGCIALDPAEAAALPDCLHARGRLEGAYEALLTEIAARLDPEPHDPWPRHATESGATLAVRLSAYRQVGGLPPLALGEDRALVAALQARDFRVRHDPGIVVETSGRLDGRAPGGAADTMRLRCAAPDSPCDDRLEAVPRALLRLALRRRLRRLHAGGRLGSIGRWAEAMGIRPEEAGRIAALPCFGQVRAAFEAASPRLAARPLRPHALARHIALARTVLAGLRLVSRLRAAAGPAGIAPPVPDAAPAQTQPSTG
ncbi:glycosyltransferase [Methylobacterium durans]|uniref:Glycosyl transferase n=1 Tax=Methylobacterium durans TaxID=2202825 RepID=A0A2U8W3K2_9HYPH|nr:glycosyltransferase [Methylobacterium durans]AWN40664.1 glycosyl transferase [Methylobacterium durans]